MKYNLNVYFSADDLQIFLSFESNELVRMDSVASQVI